MRTILPRLVMALVLTLPGLCFLPKCWGQESASPVAPFARPSSTTSVVEINQEKPAAVIQKGAPQEFSLDFPTPEELFRVQSEDSVRQKIREDGQRRGVKITEFPQDAAPAAKLADFAQTYPAQAIKLPASEICFRMLYFQDVSRERDLRSWGIGEPLRESLLFYGRVLTLPEMMVLFPPWRSQCWQYPFMP